MNHVNLADVAIYGLCGLSVLQTIVLVVLLRRRADLDLSRMEARMSHFADALALLTDTAQSGFASVAAELEQAGRKRTPTVSRAAAAKRIVSAARKGKAIQDIAAAEEVSESEVRLHLGLAEELMTPALAVAHDKPAAAPRRRGNLLNLGA